MTTVAILGGGYTGAAVAYHLSLIDTDRRTSIVVVEPRASLGAGLAYSTSDPAHRINVPAARMSLDTQDPQAFERWLAATDALEGDEDAFDGSGQSYPQRGLFGRYVADCLAPPLATGRIVHRRAFAQSVRRRGDGSFEIALSDGALHADRLVLATTHPPPAIPGALQALAGNPRFIADPTEAGALASVSAHARVLIVGNGLTAADTVATLDRLGHRGSILMLSRNGLRSRAHAPAPVEPFGDFVSKPAGTALDLIRRVRRTIAQAQALGQTWHGVLDALRGQGTEIWQALPEPERRKIVRRLRSFWDVHRFRIAPQVAGVLERLEGEGRLRSIAAGLVTSRTAPEQLLVEFRPRGTRETRTQAFDSVLNTTGPAHRSIVERQPVRSLHEEGLATLDRVGLGLQVGPDHLAVDRDGHAVPNLFVAGPLARGTFGELMGLPQVTAHAQAVAQAIAEGLGEPGRPSASTPQSHRATENIEAHPAIGS
ncbi:FAD/NAD(P)-binding protein [Aureimonas sp. ME7]|uniref:FAD/NAD(P)-binding protein n=1 Tax=Aureimonas sp. ME7 TaxID=2744252 RepID=UPI0015F5E2B1|nr:FAD/NAD(P)-binding protein [Aureimonas sp. ME7]